MRKIVFYLGLFFASTTFVKGQLRCATEQYIQEQLQADPQLENRMRLASTTVSKKEMEGSVFVPATITIPVVVHILYNIPEQNISNAQVESQIEVLNRDFNKLNPDIINVPAPFAPLAANANIRFVLAKVDPQGRATNGIIRKKTNQTSWKQNDQMKFNSTDGNDSWNSKEYLNIWVCNLDRSLLGYASFPGSSAEKDGVVIRTDVFGTINTSHPVYNKGRTTTHEVGHWLNLKHLWGNVDCGNDEVDDTPWQKNFNNGCLNFPKPSDPGCKPNPNGDMFMNFMDFTDDACIIMFTHGQAERMRNLFTEGGARAGILHSKALDAPWNTGTSVHDDPTAIPTLSVSPNPATNSISFFDKNGYAFITAEYTITNAAGYRLMQGKNRSSVDINRLTPGIYFIQLKNNGNTAVKKFMKR